MDSAIRVLLADDHPLVRAGIRTTLLAESDLALVGEAASGNEARQMCGELKPDVLLLDVQMPGPPAVQTVNFVRIRCPDIRAGCEHTGGGNCASGGTGIGAAMKE